MLLLKILEVNCGIGIRGDDVAVCVQAKEVIPDQLGNLDVQKFLSSHATGERSCKILIYNTTGGFVVTYSYDLVKPHFSNLQ